MNTKSLLTLATCALSGAAYSAEKPNLIIIHTDEQSFRTLSCYQALLPEEQAFVWGKGVNSTTPNIDKIAQIGAICTSYYCSAPVSTPSRASLITGLYPEYTGAPINGDYIREDIPTIATILRDNGYSTSYVGKWHLAGEDEKYGYGIKYKAGFDDNTYMMYGGHAPYLQIKDGKMIAGGLSSEEGEARPQDEIVHYTDFFTDKTLEILDRDKNKPFCVMLSIPDPHTPDYARPPYHTMYDSLEPQAPTTMTPEIANNRPNWASAGKNLKSEFSPEAVRQYLGMVKHIDDNVGRILSFLEDNNLMDNTIVIFTSDHGDMFYEHSRMNKGVPYESSARVPYVISYPNKIPAGKVISTSYVNTDFVPTILGLMDVKTDAKFHGFDTSKDLLSKKKSIDDSRFIYFRAAGSQWVAAVEGKYKLILDKKEVPYLFDLENDPFELENVANNPEYTKIASKMKDKLLKRLDAIDAPDRVYNTGTL